MQHDQDQFDGLLERELPVWLLDDQRVVQRANLLLLWAFGALDIGASCDPGQVVGRHAYETIAHAIERGHLPIDDPDNEVYVLIRLHAVLGKPEQEHPAVQRFLNLVYATPEAQGHWEERLREYRKLGDPLQFSLLTYPVVLLVPNGERLELEVDLRRFTLDRRVLTYGPRPSATVEITQDRLAAALAQIHEIYPDVPYVQDVRHLTVVYPARDHNEDQRIGMPFEREQATWAVAWRPGNPFPSEIGAAFVEPTEEIEHPAYGSGFAWDLGPEPHVPTRLEVFPERRMAALRFVDRARELQRRDYVLDAVGVGQADEPKSLTLISASAEERRGTVLRVYPSGEFDESFRYIHPEDPAAPAETLVWSAATARAGLTPETAQLAPSELTVYQAARHLGVNPSNVVRALRDGRLTGRKVDNRWQIDRESVERYQRRKPGPQSQES